MGNYRHWTLQEDMMLCTYHTDGISRVETARLLDRTADSIRQRKKKLGLHRILKTDIYNIVRRKRRKQNKAKE